MKFIIKLFCMIELLNERIKELRVNSGLTQAELAQKLGIAKNTLCQYEKNKSNPSLEIILQISHIFGVSADYLLGLEDDFGAKIENGASGSGEYTAEELQLINDYRSLSPGLKDMIKRTMDIYTNRITVEPNKKTTQ